MDEDLHGWSTGWPAPGGHKPGTHHNTKISQFFQAFGSNFEVSNLQQQKNKTSKTMGGWGGGLGDNIGDGNK